MLRGSKQGYKKAHENKKRFLLSNRPNILLSLNKYFMSSVKNKNLMYSQDAVEVNWDYNFYMHGCSGLRAALCNRATQYYYINIYIYIPQQVCNVQGCCINSSHSSAEFQGSKFLQQHSKENILFSAEMIYFHCRNKLFLLLKFTLSPAEWISFFY